MDDITAAADERFFRVGSAGPGGGSGLRIFLVMYKCGFKSTRSKLNARIQLGLSIIDALPRSSFSISSNARSICIRGRWT